MKARLLALVLMFAVVGIAYAEAYPPVFIRAVHLFDGVSGRLVDIVTATKPRKWRSSREWIPSSTAVSWKTIR